MILKTGIRAILLHEIVTAGRFLLCLQAGVFIWISLSLFIPERESLTVEHELLLTTHGAELYENLLRYIRGCTEAVGRGERISVSGPLGIAGRLRQELDRSSELLETAMSFYDPVDLAVSHAANTAVYSLKMAVDMGLSGEEVEDVTAAALLHDIGFGRMPIFHQERDDLLLREGEREEMISKEDRAFIKMHPEAGYESIERGDARAGKIAEIILQHHERADGTGYPRGLQESEQLLEARILAIIDTYEDFIHPRPYREALAPPAGIDAIRQSKAGAFSADLIKELLLSFSVCPLGHYVRLSDDSIARVVKTSREFPLRPDVEVYVDGGGRKLDSPRRVSLRDEQLIYIAECLPGFK